MLSDSRGEVDPDQEDVLRLKGGDKDALGRLFRKHHKFLFSFAMTLWQHAQDAEDSVQEAFVRAYAKISGFDGKCLFKTWIFTILRNHFLTERSKKYRSTQSLETLIERSGQEPAAVTATRAPFENTSLEGVTPELLQSALAGLKEEQRTAIELHYRQGMKIQQIAEIMEKSEGNIKVLLYRGRNALATHIAGHCGGPNA